MIFQKTFTLKFYKMTIYEFVQKHRTEVVFGPNGYYECYVDYKPGDNPWGTGPNILEALDNGVMNYMIKVYKLNAVSTMTSESHQQKLEELKRFLSEESLFIWYFFARKHDKKRIIKHYEDEAIKTNPEFLNVMRFMHDKIYETIENPKTTIIDNYAALNNIFIQAIVFHESLEKELYSNNALIRKMRDELDEKARETFDGLQKQITEIESELQKLED